MKIIKNEKAQAMVETVIIMPLLLLIVFACLQIFIYVLNFSISNYVLFKTNRVIAVSEKKDINNSTFLTGVALSYIMPVRNKLYFPMGITPYEHKLDNKTSAYSVFLPYATRIFGSTIARIFPNVLPGGRYYENKARSKIIKSPNEDYYKKAYPKADSF